MCPNDDSPIFMPISRFHTLSMMVSSSSSSSSSPQQSHQQRKQDQDHQNQTSPQQPDHLSARPRRPSQVQTSFQSQSSLSSTGPASAISSSTMPSPISQLGSPVLSPNPATLAASPEHSGRESEEQFPPAPFHLPDSIVLSKKVSSGSLGGAAKSSNSSSAGTATPASNQGSLIRRLSSRASRMTQRRRPSATAQSSRDASVGPNIMRRRSDSNTGPGYALLTDSDSDIPEADELLLAGQAQEPPFSATSYISAGSFACSVAGAASAGTQASSASSAAHLNCAPTIPARLREGTSMRKVSKKNKAKDICLQLQIESYSDKISWDKTRPNKCLHIDDIREIRKGSDIRQYRLDFGFPEPDEPRWFSIIYAVGGAGAGARSKNNKTMHLIAPDDDTFRDWTETLDAIARHRQFAMIALMNFTEDAVREFWLREHADDAEELDFAGIERVCRNLHINASSLLLRAALEIVDARRTGRLNFEGFRQFIRHLNTRADVNRIYLQVAQDPGRGITAPEFLHFLRHQQREDVDSAVFQWETVFSQFASRFPIDARDGSDQDRDSDASSLLNAATAGHGELRMSDVAFASYLTSSENSPIREPPAECRLDRPLNEYFISSSHNTYLLGRQVYGQSTVEGYISALVQGCRCVEVDCWDGPNGLPVVNHGRTFTTAISFQEAITTINKYAFHKSRLPLWISFEVHCSPPQQAVMATIIKATFGARLVTEPLETTSADSTTLPSPSELIDRILIKVKQASATATTTMTEPAEAIEPTTTTTRRRGASLGSASQQQPAIVQELAGISQSVPQSPLLSPSGGGATTSAPAPAPTRRLAPAAVARRFGNNSSGSNNNNNSNITSAPGDGDLGGSASPSDNESGTERTSFATNHNYFLHHTNSNNSTNSAGKDPSPAPPARRYHQKSVTAKIIKPLGDLGVYCAGVKFKGFDAAEAKLFNHIFSFVESSFAKYSRSREERKALDWHNMRFLMRVYPNQTRVMSDNFDPLLYWRRGVQMAALNWQTFDLGAQLNRAMFEGGTDSSGYVLKPRELREIQVMPDGWLGKRERKSVSFSIDVISARQLIRPSSLPAGKQMNPYVEVEVFHASDRRDKKESISTTLDALDAAAAADTPLRFQTHVVTDNGFNPTWWTGVSGGGGGPDSDGKKRSSFNVRLTTKYPDLIFIRWTVRLAHSSEPYAVFTAKLANLKQGYRTLPLLSPATGDQYLFSTLFCRISVDPIQKVLLDYPGDRQPDNSYKLRGLGRTVFARASSPKPSMEKIDS